MAANNVSDSEVEEVSFSSSSDSEDLMARSGGGVKPYQYEPLARRSVDGRKQERSDSEDEVEKQMEQGAQSGRLGHTDWCSCGRCQPMQFAVDCVCCKEVTPVLERLANSNKNCVSELDGFQVNCLNIDVLEASFYESLDVEHGPLGEDEDIHRMYRHIAYRRFTRYIWKLLGKKNRRVIPACAVCAIRGRFPSERYTHFRYPRP